MKNKEITITCYNQKQVFSTKQKAMEYFMECFAACDPASSEAGRYMYIIQQIMDGETDITDDNY